MGKKTKIPLEQAWDNWRNCLKGDDPNSILQHITLAIWDTAIFRIIFEGRKLYVEQNPQSPKISGFLHSFIDRNYFLVQCAFIRRLTDKSSLTGNLGVYSLRALIDDMREYKTEFTREEYLRLRNMAYDYSEIRKKEEEFFRNQHQGTVFFVPSEFDWQSIEEAHQIFDRLAGVSSASREPSDLVADQVFIRLQERLSYCLHIKKYVDKYFAHSASPESRSTYLESEISLNQLWEAQKILFEVAEFISIVLFSQSNMALAIENPGFFEFWDVPLVGENSIYLVRSTLENYRKETENWNANNIWQWIEEK